MLVTPGRGGVVGILRLIVLDFKCIGLRSYMYG